MVVDIMRNKMIDCIDESSNILHFLHAQEQIEHLNNPRQTKEYTIDSDT